MAISGGLLHVPARVETALPAAEQGAPLRRRRGGFVRRVLVTADLCALLAAFLASGLLSGDAGLGADELLVFVAALPAWLAAAASIGLYDRNRDHADHSTGDELVELVQAVSVGVCCVVAVAALAGAPAPPSALSLYWALAVCFLAVGRALARAWCRRHPAFVERTLLVGSGPSASAVARKLQSHPEYGLELVGLVDVDSATVRTASAPVVGRLDEVARVARELHVDRVIVAPPVNVHDEARDVIRRLRELGVQTDLVPPLCDVVGTGGKLHALEGLRLIGLPAVRSSRLERTLKRAFDVLVSTTSLVLLAPLFLGVALMIRADSRGPVFFRQLRMGANEQPFRILKFRTMVEDAEARKAELAALNIYAEDGDERMFKAHDDPRVTRVGRLLRRTSLDELPQLVNVLSGQMSLVGPRPLVLEEDRHITGWGRSRLLRARASQARGRRSGATRSRSTR